MVESKCRDLGVTFRPWQPHVGRLVLAKREDGTYAATVGGVCLSLPRQVGKTFLVGAIVFALCLIYPNLTVIWTAHRIRTAEETFGKMKAFASRRKVRPHIGKPDGGKGIITGSGDEGIYFRNGSRILFGARESGFGLGFDEVDVLIFDEAQRLKASTLDDMVPAANQSRQAQSALVLFLGTPPRPTDNGEVFTRKRNEALFAEDDDTAWIECGADDDYVPTPLPEPLTAHDWEQIARANPSFPEDTPRAAILRMRKMLGTDSFLREGAGVWDEGQATGDLPYGRWEELAAPADERGTRVVFGADVAEDRTAWIAAAWWRPDGSVHVELTNQGEPLPAFRLVEECQRVTRLWSGILVPPRAFEEELLRAGVQTENMKQGTFAAACGTFADRLDRGTIYHGNQSTLNAAVRRARWRAVGTAGERAWKMKDAPEVGPLVAVTRALYGLTKEVEPWAVYD